MEKFEHPFTAVVAGPTGSGKTVLVRKILANHSLVISKLPIDRPPRITWCYGIATTLNKQPIPNCIVSYSEGMNEKDIFDTKPDVLVIDDLMAEKSSDTSLANLFTRGSHDMNMTVIFIVQNFFSKGNQMRTISLNAKYIILLKNPRDKSQVYSLGRQLFPNQINYFREAYEDATKRKHGYLLIDLSQNCDDNHRLRTDIFNIHPKLGYTPSIYIST